MLEKGRIDVVRAPPGAGQRMLPGRFGEYDARPTLVVRAQTAIKA
jgi:hypothetical protein